MDTSYGARALGQGAVVPLYAEYATKIRAAEQVTPLTSELFGDSVSLYNGQTEFSNVDIDVPGNNTLPVQLRRRLAIVPAKLSAEPQSYGGFGNWDIDVPYISGVFDAIEEWGNGSVPPKARCSSAFIPTPRANFVPSDIWSGASVHIPGKGERELMRLDSGGARPTDATYYWTTRDFDAFSCTPSTANGFPGEGFRMRTPEGVTYTFDWVAKRAMPGVTRGVNSINRAEENPRIRIYLLATKVQDRYGNFVEYSYDGGGNLQRIRSSDGREITLGWSGGLVRSATQNPQNPDPAQRRTWSYSYQTYAVSDSPRLTGVTLPDLSTWAFRYTNDLYIDYGAWDGGNDGPRCISPPMDPGQFTLGITHPSGAVGTFSFQMQRNFRNGVTNNCVAAPGGGYYMAISDFHDVYGLISKTISGAGVSPSTWSYTQEYSASELSRVDACGARCANEKVVTVHNPDQTRTQHRFGVRFGVNEGKLLQTATLAADGAVLRSESTMYVKSAELPGRPFPDRYGTMYGGDDPSASEIWAIRSTTTLQQGVTFARYNDTFNAFARPLQVRLSSSLGYTRTETTIYKDDDYRAKWLLGLVASVRESSTGKYLVENTYDNDGNLREVKEFGKLVRSMTYRGDGTLATVTDGAGSAHTTTLGLFKRGIPTSVTLGDGTSDRAVTSAVIDDLGQIESVTDALGSMTSYTYDPVGRMKTITHPPGDSVAWNKTIVDYGAVSSSPEVGLSGTHWRQTTTTGNAKKITYYDALWRPMVTAEYDASSTDSQTSTQRYVKRGYDYANRETFVSYPSAIANPTTGSRATYDALGRTVGTSRDSELGALTTKVEYPTSGYPLSFRKQVTDARGNVTTTSFKAFDTPSEDAPLTITAPEGVTVSILRDVFNKPTSVTRSGSYGGNPISQVRSYIYDEHERLCKTVEPESGATIQGYDAAGNVAWMTKGSALRALTCDRDSVVASDRTVFGYDALNRLLDVTYPGSTSPLAQTWYPDGALWTIATNGATWTYKYNKRRLLEKETLAYDGKTFKLDWTHDANGAVSGLIYPDTSAIDFAPNALGQPTQAGSHATDVKYFPNGAVSGFTYGNGIVHSLKPNARQLPERSRDLKGTTPVVDLSYVYDGNANVTSIADAAQTGTGNENRSLGYDGLDRLVNANAPNLSWGTATFAYDPLDNLRKSKVGTRDCTHTIDGNNRLAQLAGPGCQTIAYGYDTLGHGNVTSRADRSFVYDRADRLTSTSGGTGNESYVYDGHGRRVRIERANNAKTYQVYSKDGQLLHELGADGQTTNYVYLNGSLVARSGVMGVPSTPDVSKNPSFDGVYTLTWDPVSGAVNYQLLQRVDGGTERAVYTGPLRTWSPPTANPSGLYAYRVAACSPACGTPGGSVTVKVLRQLGAPTANPNPSTSGSYTVSWTGIAPASGYRLDERQGTGGWSSGVYYGALTGKAFSGKTNGEWRYRVSPCVSATECGTPSDDLLVVVQPAIVDPPPVPTGLSVPAGSSNGTYTVTWDAAARATGYDLQEQFGGTWRTVASNQTGRSWSPNPPKTQSGTYSYQVSACNGGGCSPWSASRSVAVNVVPTPTGLGVTPPIVLLPRVSKYTVKWNAATAPGTTYTLEETNTGCGTGRAGQELAGLTATSKVFDAELPAACDRITYLYRIRGCEGSNCSPWSDWDNVEVTKGDPTRMAPGTVAYYHTDGLRSAVVQTDASGNVIQGTRNRYEPYGATLTSPAQGPGYTGHVTDATTGLSYMQQRYYDPLAGRFLSVDPVVANANSGDNFNRYWYANNNPYKNIDPDGRNPVLAAIVITAGIDWLLRPSIANAPAPGDATFSNVMSGVEVAQEVARVVPATKLGSMIKLGAKAGDKLSQNAAAREAKRQAGIPTSQQPSSQTNGRASDGTPVGRQQSYEVPAAGGGTESKSVQVSRDTRGDHAGMSQIEAGTVKPGGQTDVGGRPRIQNVDKVRVDFDPKR